MHFYSPLRYPGGKNKLAKFIASICIKNDIRGHYVEPYAGGASVALFLLMEGIVSEITINDIDRSIYAFWHSVLNKNNELCKLIKKTSISVKNWKLQKEVQVNKKSAKLLDLGFSTFYLNRTNMSGIINGGIIGGFSQKGEYKINCRFNKNELIRRIKSVKRYKKNINIYNLDALELVKKIQLEANFKSTIFYFDPPYYLKGESLYINAYEHDDHIKVSEEIQRIKNAQWIVSYDNNLVVKDLYKKSRKKEYSLWHTARETKLGKEVLFFSNNLIVPYKILNS